MATSAQVDALVALYAGYFNRAPDPEGLQFWIDQIDGGREFNTIAADFAASEEATALYPYLTTPDVATPSTFITSIYQNLFNRAPDAEGLQFWTDVLEAGSVSVADMIEAIINGAVDAPDATPPTFDATTLENKIEVGRDFAQDAANTSGFEFDAEAKSAAIAAIDGVTNDEATVVAAKAATDAYLAGEANEGDTFTLTAGADDINGTADNDTINALTVNASGAEATTFSAFDDIDGGAGEDTLNIFAQAAVQNGANAANAGFPASATVKNVEIVNINNINAGGFGNVDASKFQGATQIWQAAFANDVTKLAATTTAGLRDVTATAAADLTVTAADAATSASIALENLKGDTATAAANGGAPATVENQAELNVKGAALTTVNVSGSLAQATTGATAAAASLALNVELAKDAQAATVNTGVATVLSVDNEGTSTKELTSVDASASTGAVTYLGADANVATIKSGSGNDDLLIKTTTSNVAGSEAVALLDAGAGDDKITVATTGNNTTTVNAGAGKDTVTLTTDAGTGKLSVDLGEGDDAFMVDTSGQNNGTVASGDVIDGGAGSDALQLTAVGAANIASFKNFEVFDAKGLNAALDLDILATNNTVTEIITSGAVGGNAAIIDMGAGVGFRATGDMDGNALTLTQKTAGALSVGLDIDETKEATTAANAASATVDATNATSLAIDLDADFVGEAKNTKGDNVADLDVIASKATSVTIASGGDNASNNVEYEYGVNTPGTQGADGVLTSATITGSQALTVNFGQDNGQALVGDDTESNLATVDASAMTGGLTMSLGDLKNGGSVSLGSGKDKITVTAASEADNNGADAEAIVGLEKAAAAAVGTDATLAAAAIAEADLIDLSAFAAAAPNAVDPAVADANVNASGATLKDGVLTFTGAGPQTLDAAALIADDFADAAGEVVLFEYFGDSYVFVQGGNQTVITDDAMVKLSGTTGVTNLAETGTDTFFIV